MNEKHIIGMMLLRQRFRDAFHLRNTKGDKIEIVEQYIIRQGTKILFVTKGHIVQTGLITLTNILSMAHSTGFTLGATLFDTWTTKTTYMRVGTGASVTGYNTTALTTPTATAPDSQSASVTNPSNGVFKINLTSTWNAGTLAAIIVTEIGLFGAYINADTTLQAFGWATQNSVVVTVFMFSRISEADGDFAHFTVNIAVPLTITWTLTFQYA